LTFIETSFDNDVKFKAGVSVSKRNFKKAVDRNKIKRLLREAYRLNKSMLFNNITTQNAFMILYLGNEIPNFKDLEIKMKQLFEKYLTKVSKQ
jgi:ribonuclease P protein component